MYLLANARESLASRLESRDPAYGVPRPTLEVHAGAFVSLHKEARLRGCIGRMTSDRPLFETVREMARSAAFHDPRFPPLTAGELSRTEIEISVLSPLKKIASAAAVEVGVHGIYMVRRPFSGVLLPQVAVQQGWTREQFLTHTCYKAGLPGDSWRDGDIEVYVFSAIIIAEREPWLDQ